MSSSSFPPAQPLSTSVDTNGVYAGLSIVEKFHRGAALLQEGNLDEAERIFLDVIACDPGVAEAHVNIGWIQQRQQRHAEAEHAYRLACVCDPLCLQAWLNLAELLLAQKRFAEAEQYNRHACAIAPQSPRALSSLGRLLVCMHREEEAEACFREALSHDPAYDKAAFNLSYLLLRQGRFAEGWHHFETRESSVRATAIFPFSRWQGEPLQGRSLLIVREGGYGDMIQFCRYVAAIKQRGAERVGVLCDAPLHALLSQLQGVDAVLDTATPDAWRGWDCWTLTMSLPALFAMQQAIPAQLPYLSVSSDRAAYWEEKLGPHSRDTCRVGLVWKGSPSHENDAARSLPSLHVLSPLSDVVGVRFISLQKGAGEDEVATAPFPIENFASQIRDFSDTAAIIDQLDLVITIDTAVAHLAGALGKSCWVLLPDYMADWRWMSARNDSLWYPDVMRLFRQRVDGDWESVIADVREALVAWHDVFV